MFTLGTAGHIDHGKTTLCRHLTGVDTDRLREEKERGISIELGFAELETASGRRVGLVDVPGHERFVRTMVAGVSGIDAVLFVIAADEGVMPQTREHFDIIEMLGIGSGIVVLTKCDIADPDLVEIVEEDVRDFFRGTCLEGAPLLRTSPDDPASYEAVRAAVDDLISGLKPRRRSGHFRLPVDRVFTLKGHGTIVTGTVVSGTIAKGTQVEIQPGSMASRVRSIQTFGENADEVVGGQRAALNLPDVPASAVSRGACVCPPGVFEPTFMIDGSFKLLRKLPKGFNTLEHAARIRFHVGTSEVIGRVHLMNCDRLEQGGEALVQFRLEAPVVAARSDRFLVRTFSPMYTIGGGIILDASPKKHKNRAKAAAELERLTASDPRELALNVLENTPRLLLSLDDLAEALSCPAEQLTPHLPPATGDAGILLFETQKGRLYGAERRILAERARLVSLVDAYHREHPTSPGMARATLSQEFGSQVRPEAFAILLDQVTAAGDLVTTGKLIARNGFQPRLDAELTSGLDSVRKALSTEGQPLWTPKALAEHCKVKEKTLQKVIGLLLNSDEIRRLPGGNFALAARVDELERQVLAFIRDSGGSADTNAIKQHVGLTRKHLIPFLESLDERGITLRTGNERRIRGE